MTPTEDRVINLINERFDEFRIQEQEQREKTYDKINALFREGLEMDGRIILLEEDKNRRDKLSIYMTVALFSNVLALIGAIILFTLKSHGG